MGGREPRISSTVSAGLLGGGVEGGGRLCQGEGQAFLTHGGVGGSQEPPQASGGVCGGGLLHAWHTPSCGRAVGQRGRPVRPPSVWPQHATPETDVGAVPPWLVHPQGVSGTQVWASACLPFTSCHSVLSPASAHPGRRSQTEPKLMSHQTAWPPPLPGTH